LQNTSESEYGYFIIDVTQNDSNLNGKLAMQAISNININLGIAITGNVSEDKISFSFYDSKYGNFSFNGTITDEFISRGTFQNSYIYYLISEGENC